MVPASHTLWAGCWLGIATDAVSIARAITRQKARQNPGVVSPAARRLADVVVSLELMHDKVFAIAREFDEMRRAGDPRAFEDLGFALRVNGLKLAASTMVARIVMDALEISGIAAYKNDSPHALGRHLRDACSAALMINNDRLRETNASMLMVRKGD
jgi:acyl-CoA dehydrogenase